MDSKRIAIIKSDFDSIMHLIKNTNIEYWYARDLMRLLGYERWKNFDKAIQRAMESCESSSIEISDHFREVTKMITVGT